MKFKFHIISENSLVLDSVEHEEVFLIQKQRIHK